MDSQAGIAIVAKPGKKKEKPKPKKDESKK